MRFIVRYLKFVTACTIVIFTLMMGAALGRTLIYGVSPKAPWWETACVCFAMSVFVVAIIGLSRTVVPYLRDPDTGSRMDPRRWK